MQASQKDPGSKAEMEPREFAVAQEPLGFPGGVLVAIEGELDMLTAPTVREHLNTAMDHGATRIVVDLERVSFIDSVSLAVLLTARRRLGDGGRLAVVSDPSSYATLIFEAGGVDAVLDLFDGRDDAVAHVAG